MTVKTVVTYTNDEVHTMIDTLNFLANIVNGDETATPEIKQKADEIFGLLADLLCLDENGRQAFEYEGW